MKLLDTPKYLSLILLLAGMIATSQAQMGEHQLEMLPPPPDVMPQPYIGQPAASQPYVNPQYVQQPYFEQPSIIQPMMGPSDPNTIQTYVPPPVNVQPIPTIQPPVLADIPTEDSAEVELTTENPPFEPVWYNPFSWIGPWWNGSVSLGINGSEGNANAFNIRSGFELSRETERANWDLDLTYNKTTADDLETAHNALLQSNWDYKLQNPRWTWFNKLGLEYDEFKNFDLRLFLNSGVGYTFIDNEITQFRGRFGSGVSREFGGVDEDWKPEAVFGIDYARQMTERQRFVATVDYYPAWEDFSDYRIVSDFGWEIDLDAPTNLSLKFGVIDRYDSTPNGALANDVDYSVLLIWTL